MPLVCALLVAACSTALPPEAQPVAPPPPPPPPVQPVAPDQGKQLVVGVDDLGTGFNPHLISDQSPLCTEVAALVLPSVFAIIQGRAHRRSASLDPDDPARGGFASAGWDVDECAQLFTHGESALVIKGFVVKRSTKKTLRTVLCLQSSVSSSASWS